MKRERVSNWDEKSLSFPKGCMVEPFVNEDGLLDIRMSSDQTQPNLLKGKQAPPTSYKVEDIYNS